MFLTTSLTSGYSFGGSSLLYNKYSGWVTTDTVLPQLGSCRALVTRVPTLIFRLVEGSCSLAPNVCGFVSYILYGGDTNIPLMVENRIRDGGPEIGNVPRLCNRVTTALTVRRFFVGGGGERERTRWSSTTGVWGPAGGQIGPLLWPLGHLSRCSGLRQVSAYDWAGGPDCRRQPEKDLVL